MPTLARLFLHLRTTFALSLLLSAIPVRAETVNIMSESPEGQNIANAANLLERLGAVDVASRVRERLQAGKYSYGNLGAANGETRTGSQYTTIDTQTIRNDIPALRGKPLDPNKDFGKIFSLARTLFHEDVHSGQGYFSALWGSLPGETTHETDAWTKTITAETSWVMNGLSFQTFSSPQIQIMAADLEGYISSFGENDFYGLDKSLQPGYLGLQEYMKKLADALSRSSTQQNSAGTGTGADTGSAQPPPSSATGSGATSSGGSSVPHLGITCKNSNDDCSDLGRTAAQKQMEAVRAKDELSQVPYWLAQADSLDHDAQSYRDEADHSSKLAAGYAELNDSTNEAFYKAQANEYQAKSQAAGAQGKALREKANSAKANADALEKAAQDAWNKYYACLGLPLCPKATTGTSAGGNTIGGGTAGSGSGTTSVSFNDCPEAKSALDSANFWHQQAVKDLELAAQSKLEGNASRSEGWELQARLDESSARMWERQAAYWLEQCHEKKTTVAERQQGPTPSVGGTGANSTPSIGTNSASVGSANGAKKEEFAGGTEKRVNFGKIGYEITRTSADGSVTEVAIYGANGRLISSRRDEPSSNIPGGTKITYPNDEGSYTTIDQSGEFSSTYRQIKIDYDKDGKPLKRITFTNPHDNAAGFTEVVETFQSNGTIVTTTTHWSGSKLRNDPPDNVTTTTTSTPGLDQFGKDLQKALEDEGKTQSGDKGFHPPAAVPEEDHRGALDSSPALPLGGASSQPSIGPIVFGDVFGTGTPQIIVGSVPGDTPQVRVFDGKTGNLLSSFFAYNPSFLGGVNVAAGNVNGSGPADIVTGPASGFSPYVKVFSGSGLQLNGFFAYDPSFRDGVNVAVGDVDGDGYADIITGAGPGGGPHVKVFSGTGLQLNSFFAYDPTFRGGVNVTAGDVNGDGKAEIITGPGGGPQVKVFDGANGQLLSSFFAYDPSFTGGVFVAAGDVNGDGKSEIITGAGPGGGPQVKLFTGTGQPLNTFSFNEPNFTGGIRVAVGDVNGDGVPDIISGAGAGGGPHVKIFDGTTGQSVNNYFVLPQPFLGISPLPSDTFNPYLYGAPTTNSSLGLDTDTQLTFTDPYSSGKKSMLRSPQNGDSMLAARAARGVHRERSGASGFFQTVAFRSTESRNEHAQTAVSSSAAERSAPSAEPEAVEFSIVSTGKTGDEAFQLQVFDPKNQLKQAQIPQGVVLEPIKHSDTKPVASRHPGAKALTQQIGALCLDFAKLPPEVGTLYRVAPATVQQKFKPMRSILEAGHKLADKGQLHPDSEPKAYETFVRQFALWTKIEHWDAAKFTEVFLQRSKENAKVMNVKWTQEMENALLGAAPGRWRDITAVLTEAENISKTRTVRPAD